MTAQDQQPPAQPDIRDLLSARKLIVQVLGFILGLALLAWIVRNAVQEGNWERLLHTSPWLIAALLGCTVISSLLNASTFWITMLPIRNVGFWNMQRLNLVANMLNYAPVRLGALSRILYALRVDRLSLLRVGAWFTMIGFVLMLGIGACLLAVLAHRQIDWIWLAIVISLMIVGGLTLRAMATMGWLQRYGQGIDQMFADKRALWGAIAMRLLDLAAYTGRMTAALAIVGAHVPLSHAVVLALVALASSLTPIGRVGVREWCVAMTAGLLSIDEASLTVSWAELALVESMGEALIFIPGGALVLPWLRRQWKRTTPANSPDTEAT